jgi:2'-5' RNA ligase
MNSRYLGLLFLMTAVMVYGQNPSSQEEVFARAVQKANADYETLTADEKEVCKLIRKNVAVQSAREWRGMNRTELIPAEIDPDDNLDVIDQSLEAAKARAGLSEERLKFVLLIASFRLAGLFNAKAASAGIQSICVDNEESIKYLND